MSNEQSHFSRLSALSEQLCVSLAGRAELLLRDLRGAERLEVEPLRALLSNVYNVLVVETKYN